MCRENSQGEANLIPAMPCERSKETREVSIIEARAIMYYLFGVCFTLDLDLCESSSCLGVGLPPLLRCWGPRGERGSSAFGEAGGRALEAMSSHPPPRS